MNNPARHNLDDVTLRAENGEIVIETDEGDIVGTVSGDLNIEGLLSAENAEFEALEAETVTIGNVSDRVSLSSDVVYEDDVDTQIGFGTVIHDNLGAIDGNKFVAPSNGVYALSAYWRTDSDLDQSRTRIQIDGSTEFTQDIRTAFYDANSTVFVPTAVFEASEGDDIMLNWRVRGTDAEMTGVARQRQVSFWRVR